MYRWEKGLTMLLLVNMVLVSGAEKGNYYSAGGPNGMCVKEMSSAKITNLTHAPYEKELLSVAGKAGIRVMPYVDLEKTVKSSGDPILLRNPFWRAVDAETNKHPEWFCINPDGKIRRPFSNPSYHPGFEQSCNNHGSLAEAQIKGGREMMALGVGGVFVDNAYPRCECFGGILEMHKHDWPEKTNSECYAEAARKFYDAIKSVGGDCYINCGFAAEQKGKADLVMIEGQIYLVEHSKENKDNMDRKYWRTKIAYWKNLKNDIASLEIFQNDIPRAGYSALMDPCSSDEAAFFSFAYTKMLGTKYWHVSTSQWAADIPNFLFRNDMIRLLYRIHNELGEPVSEVIYTDKYGYQSFRNAVVVINPDEENGVSVKVPVKGLALPVADLFSGEGLEAKDDIVELTMPYESARVVMNVNSVLENYLTETTVEAEVLQDYIANELKLKNPEFSNLSTAINFESIAKRSAAALEKLKKGEKPDLPEINSLSIDTAAIDMDKIMKSASETIVSGAKDMSAGSIRELLTLQNDVPKVEIFRGGAERDVIKFVVRSARSSFVPFHYDSKTFLNVGEDVYFNLSSGPVITMGSSGETFMNWRARRTASLQIQKKADMGVKDGSVVPFSMESLDQLSENGDGGQYRAICRLRGLSTLKEVKNYKLQMDFSVQKGQPFLNLEFSLLDGNKNKVEDAGMSFTFSGTDGYISPAHAEVSQAADKAQWAYFVSNPNDRSGIIALGAPELDLVRNGLRGKGSLKCSIGQLCPREYYFISERLRNLKLYAGKSAALVNDIYLTNEAVGNLTMNSENRISFRLNNKSPEKINNVKWKVRGGLIGCTKDNLTPLNMKIDGQKGQDKITCSFLIPKNFIQNDIAFFTAEAELTLGNGRKFVLENFFSVRIKEPLHIGAFNIFRPSGACGEKAGVKISSVPACKGKASLKINSEKIASVPESMEFSIPENGQKMLVFDIKAPDEMMNGSVGGVLKIETDISEKKEIPVVAKFSPRAEISMKNEKVDIDGNLDKEVWRDTGFMLKDFISFSTGKKANDQTEVGIFYTENALYIGFKCHTKDMKSLTELAMADKDGYSGAALKDDSIEIYIRPTPERDGHYIRLGGNCKSIKRLDQFLDVSLVNAGIYQESTRTWRMATKKHSDRWDAEIEIPFSVIGYKPEKGAVWGINFCRNQPRGDIASSWSFTDGEYNKPNYMGWITFR